jgi:hypothetical protein
LVFPFSNHLDDIGHVGKAIKFGGVVSRRS